MSSVETRTHCYGHVMRDEEHILRKVLRMDTQEKKAEKTTENEKERRSEKGRSAVVLVTLHHGRKARGKEENIKKVKVVFI